MDLRSKGVRSEENDALWMNFLPQKWTERYILSVGTVERGGGIETDGKPKEGVTSSWREELRKI